MKRQERHGNYMVVLKGKPVADSICDNIKNSIEELIQKGIEPGIAIVRVGKKPDDIYY